MRGRRSDHNLRAVNDSVVAPNLGIRLDIRKGQRMNGIAGSYVLLSPTKLFLPRRIEISEYPDCKAMRLSVRAVAGTVQQACGAKMQQEVSNRLLLLLGHTVARSSKAND